MKQLHLKNAFFISNQVLGVYSLYEWLAMRQLHGKASRNRTRFLRLIEDRQKEVQDTRKKMLEDHAEKNAEGQVLFLDKEGHDTVIAEDGVTFKIKDNAGLEKALNEYLEEELVLDNLPERQEIIHSVRETVLETDDEFTGRMATLYDQWCDAFDKLQDAPKD